MDNVITLPADIEKVLRRRAAASGEDLAAFVSHVVSDSLIDNEQPPPHDPASGVCPADGELDRVASGFGSRD